MQFTDLLEREEKEKGANADALECSEQVSARRAASRLHGNGSARQHSIPAPAAAGWGVRAAARVSPS